MLLPLLIVAWLEVMCGVAALLCGTRMPRPKPAADGLPLTGTTSPPNEAPRVATTVKASKEPVWLRQYRGEQQLKEGVQLTRDDDNQFVRSIVQHCIRGTTYPTPLPIWYIYKVSNPSFSVDKWLQAHISSRVLHLAQQHNAVAPLPYTSQPYVNTSLMSQVHGEGQFAWLWHGSSRANLISIINNGFDLSKARPSCSLGQKIYLSQSPNYSLTYSSRSDPGHHGVLLCLAHIQQDAMHYGSIVGNTHMQYAVDRHDLILPQYLVIFGPPQPGFVNLQFTCAGSLGKVWLSVAVTTSFDKIQEQYCKAAGCHHLVIEMHYDNVKLVANATPQGHNMADGATIHVRLVCLK